MKELFDKLYNKSEESFYKILDKNLKENKKTFIVTANPETFMMSEKDTEMRDLLLDKDTILVPDGIGIVKAARMINYDIKERIAGIDIANKLLELGNKQKKSIYLFGAKQEVIDSMKEVLKNNYPNLKLSGTANGYEKDKEGSINMLYVSEYDATPFSYLVAKIKGEEINSNKDRQISNESVKDINKRNKIMRDNSLDTATIVAYKGAGKTINIKSKKNIVMAKTNDNDFEVGDIILTVNDNTCEDVNAIREIINNSNENDIIKFKVLRDDKEVEVDGKVVLEDNRKIIGIIITTDYEYDLDPEITIKFKNSESGASGGLMLTLTIYNAISGEDLIKGRNIAGTGTINLDGTVGEIDGVKYKIMGANNSNMDIVFVPSANYEEAISVKEKYNYDMDIIKVDTFNEVLEYLRNN